VQANTLVSLIKLNSSESAICFHSIYSISSDKGFFAWNLSCLKQKQQHERLNVLQDRNKFKHFPSFAFL